MDDDELLEIAVRDVSYHIQLKKRQEEENDDDMYKTPRPRARTSSGFGSVGSNNLGKESSSSSSFDASRPRFNPRIDPTVLYLEIKKLTLNLDDFFFRIEKAVGKTVFDPVFEGQGMLSLQNISIQIRVDCAKDRLKETNTEGVIWAPILLLRELDVALDKLQMTVKDTGFGSDWILNKAVDVFEASVTEIVEENLKERIKEQIENVIESLNAYFLMNPGVLLNLLGISMEDLDENVVWV